MKARNKKAFRDIKVALQQEEIVEVQPLHWKSEIIESGTLMRCKFEDFHDVDERDAVLVKRYYALLEGLEYNNSLYEEQQLILDEFVDLLKESAEHGSMDDSAQDIE